MYIMCLLSLCKGEAVVEKGEIKLIPSIYFVYLVVTIVYYVHAYMQQKKFIWKYLLYSVFLWIYSHHVAIIVIDLESAAKSNDNT